MKPSRLNSEQFSKYLNISDIEKLKTTKEQKAGFAYELARDSDAFCAYILKRRKRWDTSGTPSRWTEPPRHYAFTDFLGTDFHDWLTWCKEFPRICFMDIKSRGPKDLPYIGSAVQEVSPVHIVNIIRNADSWEEAVEKMESYRKNGLIHLYCPPGYSSGEKAQSLAELGKEIWTEEDSKAKKSKTGRDGGLVNVGIPGLLKQHMAFRMRKVQIPWDERPTKEIPGYSSKYAFNQGADKAAALVAVLSRSVKF